MITLLYTLYRYRTTHLITGLMLGLLMGHLSGYYIGKSNQQRNDAQLISKKAINDTKVVIALQNKITDRANVVQEKINQITNLTNEINAYAKNNTKLINDNNIIRAGYIRLHNAVILQKTYTPTSWSNTATDRKCDADTVLMQLNENMRRCQICFNRYYQCQDYVKTIMGWYNDE